MLQSIRMLLLSTGTATQLPRAAARYAVKQIYGSE